MIADKLATHKRLGILKRQIAKNRKEYRKLKEIRKALERKLRTPYYLFSFFLKLKKRFAHREFNLQEAEQVIKNNAIQILCYLVDCGLLRMRADRKDKRKRLYRIR